MQTGIVAGHEAESSLKYDSRRPCQGDFRQFFMVSSGIHFVGSFDDLLIY